MRNTVVCLFLFLSSSTINAAMFRVLEVRDAQTVVVMTGAQVSVITLRNVAVSPRELDVAENYLREALTNRWVYVENGDIYRSPDGLFINKALADRAWDRGKYLGEVNPAEMAPAPKPKPTAKKPARQRTSRKG